MRIVVYHGSYGCETGCCGHWVQLDGGREHHTFDHPWKEEDDFFAYAQQAIRETFGEAHVADLDWDNSIIVASEDCPLY